MKEILIAIIAALASLLVAWFNRKGDSANQSSRSSPLPPLYDENREVETPIASWRKRRDGWTYISTALFIIYTFMPSPITIKADWDVNSNEDLVLAWVYIFPAFAWAGSLVFPFQKFTFIVVNLSPVILVVFLRISWLIYDTFIGVSNSWLLKTLLLKVLYPLGGFLIVVVAISWVLGRGWRNSR